MLNPLLFICLDFSLQLFWNIMHCKALYNVQYTHPSLTPSFRRSIPVTSTMIGFPLQIETTASSVSPANTPCGELTIIQSTGPASSLSDPTGRAPNRLISAGPSSGSYPHTSTSNSLSSWIISPTGLSRVSGTFSL